MRPPAQPRCARRVHLSQCADARTMPPRPAHRYNTTHMKYTQLSNKDSSVVDEFFVVQHKHGPFDRAAGL